MNKCYNFINYSYEIFLIILDVLKRIEKKKLNYYLVNYMYNWGRAR